MFVSSIICEYNPFHNGHKYQIMKTREAGATHIIAIMSGNFVQRGEIAIIDKHKRAQIAVQNGADLVIELPAPFSFSSAELFAKSAIYIINKLGVSDTLSFGSESGNISLLQKAAQITTKYQNSSEFKELISSGLSYPSAMGNIIKQNHENTLADIINTPNNMLGIEYLKAIDHFNSNMTPVTIKREKVSHDSEQVNGQFASASLIRRKIIENNDFICYVPPTSYNIIQHSIATLQLANFTNLNQIFLYRLYFMSQNDFSNLPDVTNALADRLYKATQKARSFDELLMLTKTKCFTLARIRRVLCYALMGITKQDLNNPPQYARILAFNKKGCEILAQIKKQSDFPISTSLADLEKINPLAARQAQIDVLCSNIFSLATNNPNFKKNEYSIKIAKQ